MAYKYRGTVNLKHGIFDSLILCSPLYPTLLTFVCTFALTRSCGKHSPFLLPPHHEGGRAIVNLTVWRRPWGSNNNHDNYHRHTPPRVRTELWSRGQSTKSLTRTRGQVRPTPRWSSTPSSNRISKTPGAFSIPPGENPRASQMTKTRKHWGSKH